MCAWYNTDLEGFRINLASPRYEAKEYEVERNERQLVLVCRPPLSILVRRDYCQTEENKLTCGSTRLVKQVDYLGPFLGMQFSSCRPGSEFQENCRRGKGGEIELSCISRSSTKRTWGHSSRFAHGLEKMV